MRTQAVIKLTRRQERDLVALFSVLRESELGCLVIGQLLNDDAGRYIIKLGLVEPEKALQVQRLLSPELSGEVSKLTIP